MWIVSLAYGHMALGLVAIGISAGQKKDIVVTTVAAIVNITISGRVVGWW